MGLQRESAGEDEGQENRFKSKSEQGVGRVSTH